MPAYRSIPRNQPIVEEKQVEEDEVVLSDLLKADLVDLAESKGIDSSGTKAELIARLEKA